jgi:hypothetical protein
VIFVAIGSVRRWLFGFVRASVQVSACGEALDFSDGRVCCFAVLYREEYAKMKTKAAIGYAAGQPFEWGAAEILGGELGTAYLGTRGDMRDAQTRQWHWQARCR